MIFLRVFLPLEMNVGVPSSRIRPCRTLQDPAAMLSPSAPGTHTAAASLQIRRPPLRGGTGEPEVGGGNTVLSRVSELEDLLLFLRQAGHNPGCLVPSALGLVNV